MDYQDRRPIYEQVVERFQTLILSGAIPPGERLPSVRQLAMDLSINPNTIQRAYMELEQQGLIYPVKGKNFVTDSSGVREAGRETFWKEIRELVKKDARLVSPKMKCGTWYMRVTRRRAYDRD